MMNLISALLWIPAWIIRLVLILIGLPAVLLGLVADGANRTPKMWRLWGNSEDIPKWWTDDKGDSRWSKWWWMAIRNPTQGFNKLFKQPILEPRPNPDNLVYSGEQKSAYRWLRHGIYSEFWYLRAIGAKKFEFRIGWKFADGTPGFVPTIQLRYGL
jgi:hypothetical protein